MSLKSIRENYSKFIRVLESAGVKLNTSQKSDLDSFILAIESKMQNQKQKAIKATKKIVESHVESKFKKIFESILKHQEKNALLSSKIQNKISSIKSKKHIARKVNDYLDLYVESVLPKKTIVDYDRMQRLEKLHESLKDMLVVDDDSVKAKKAELTNTFNSERKKLETQIAKLQVKLNESMAKSLRLNKKIDSFKAQELLESKTKDLPSYEARQIKRRFANASTVEIEKTFNRVLESVKNELKVDEFEEENAIESEVKEIIDAEDEVEENDLLKGRHHNGHITEKDDEVEENDLLNGRHHNGHIAEDEEEDVKESEDIEENDEEDDEVVECGKSKDSTDDVELDESEIIDQSLMKLWCREFNHFNSQN